MNPEKAADTSTDSKPGFWSRFSSSASKKSKSNSGTKTTNSNNASLEKLPNEIKVTPAQESNSASQKTSKLDLPELPLIQQRRFSLSGKIEEKNSNSAQLSVNSVLNERRSSLVPDTALDFPSLSAQVSSSVSSSQQQQQSSGIIPRKSYESMTQASQKNLKEEPRKDASISRQVSNVSSHKNLREDISVSRKISTQMTDLKEFSALIDPSTEEFAETKSTISFMSNVHHLSLNRGGRGDNRPSNSNHSLHHLMSQIMDAPESPANEDGFEAIEYDKEFDELFHDMFPPVASDWANLTQIARKRSTQCPDGETQSPQNPILLQQTSSLSAKVTETNLLVPSSSPASALFASSNRINNQVVPVSAPATSQASGGDMAMIRVFRRDNTFSTVSCVSTVTAKDLCQTLGRKFFLPADQAPNYQLWLERQGSEWLINGDDKPIKIQQRLLTDQGYDSKIDKFNDVLREEHTFLFRWVYSDISAFLFSLDTWNLFNQSSALFQPENMIEQKIVECGHILRGDHIVESSVLDLSSCGISSIPNGILSKMEHVSTVDLHQNHSLSLSLDFFVAAKNVTTLILASCYLFRVPIGIGHLSALITLDLSNNFITTLRDSELGYLRQLKHLRLRNNRLRGRNSLPLTIVRSWVSLEKLDLGCNFLKGECPRSIAMIGAGDDADDCILKQPTDRPVSNLIELDLSFNWLTSLPSDIGYRYPRLSCLNLFSNRLKKLPESLQIACQYLEILDIRSNGIKGKFEFPSPQADSDNIYKLTKIMVANNDISELHLNNQMMQLRSVISNRNTSLLQVGLSMLLPNLTTLVLSCSKLASLPENTFLQTPFLQVLLLNNNQLTGLPTSINSLSAVVRLDASNNSISALPKTIREMKALEILDLHGNNLKTLPVEMWELKLVYLNLSSNVIESWPENPFLSQPTGTERLSSSSAFSNNRRSALILSGATTSPLSEYRQSQRMSINFDAQNSFTLQISPLINSLKWLSLADNRIELTLFENLISHLFSLQSLNVAQNDLFSFPPGTLKNSAGSLEELILSGNQLTQLPEELFSFKKMKRLYINGNRLGSLPPEIGKLSQLKILDAGRNQLRYNVNNWPYDWNWNWNPDLRYLNLSGNPRLEIKIPQPTRPAVDAKKDKSSKDRGTEADQNNGELTKFDLLHKMRILGLMEVSVSVGLPDENNRRRIRVFAPGGASTNWKRHMTPIEDTTITIQSPNSPAAPSPTPSTPLLSASGGSPISGPVNGVENNYFVAPPISYGVADNLGSGEKNNTWDTIVLNTKWVQNAREESRAAAQAMNLPGAGTPQPRRSAKQSEHLFCIFDAGPDLGSWCAKQVTESFGTRLASELKRLFKENLFRKESSPILSEKNLIQASIRRTFLQIYKQLGNHAASHITKFRNRLNPDELAEYAKRSAMKTKTAELSQESTYESPQSSSRWRRLASSTDLSSKLKKLIKEESTSQQSTPIFGRKSRRSSASNEIEAVKIRLVKLNDVKEASVDELHHEATAVSPSGRTRSASAASAYLLSSAEASHPLRKKSVDVGAPMNVSAENFDNLENNYEQLLDSGISGLVVYIVANQLFIANVGDASAVLCRSGTAVSISTRHSLFTYYSSISNPHSSEKAEEAGTDVETPPLPVEPNEKAQVKPLTIESWSNFSRREMLRLRKIGAPINLDGSIGHSHLTRKIGSYRESSAIIPEPSLITLDITEQDEFLIIASAEFWKTMSYQTAVDIARLKADDALEAALVLRDFAIAYSSRYSYVCDFDGERPDERAKLIRCNAKLGTNFTLPRDPFTVIVINLRDCLVTKTQKKVFNRIRRRKEEVMDSAIARLAPEVEPPTGFLAIVFTDVRNSTQLWERKPVSMRVAIREHNFIMRRNLRFFNGYEVKTEGDAFMVAFKSVLDAICWCLTVQQQLLEADWPQDLIDLSDGQNVYGPKIMSDPKSEKTLLYRGLSVRMGMHCGAPVCEPDPITRRMDYFGPMVNKTARVSGNADGGQLLVSTDVERVIRQMKAGTFLEDQGSKSKASNLNEKLMGLSHLEPVFFDIGERKLKGFDNPEVLYSVYPGNLASRHEIPPPPASGELAGKSPDEVAEAEAEKLEAMTGRNLATGDITQQLLNRSGSNLKLPEANRVQKTPEILQFEKLVERIQNVTLYALAKRFQPGLLPGDSATDSTVNPHQQLLKWIDNRNLSKSSPSDLQESIHQLEFCLSALTLSLDEDSEPSSHDLIQSLKWLLCLSLHSK